MSFDNIKIYMQNGKLTDLEINYYINKLKKIYQSKKLQRISFILGEDYIDLRYMFEAYPLKEYGESPLKNNIKKDYRKNLR